MEENYAFIDYHDVFGLVGHCAVRLPEFRPGEYTRSRTECGSESIHRNLV